MNNFDLSLKFPETSETDEERQKTRNFIQNIWRKRIRRGALIWDQEMINHYNLEQHKFLQEDSLKCCKLRELTNVCYF